MKKVGYAFLCILLFLSSVIVYAATTITDSSIIIGAHTLTIHSNGTLLINGSPVGITGPQGEPGVKGDPGDVGVTGPQGIPGVQGEGGPQGIQGLQGIQGGVGSQGIQGVQGERGFNGTQGVQGVQGFNGTQGIQGIQGFNGTQGIQGIQGVPGANGATWYSASGVPGSGLGVNGDQYLNTANGDVYLKSGGVWSVVGNIVGPTGPKGDKGDTGNTGTPGASSFDVNYYRHTGVTTYEAWYTSPRAGTALAGTVLVANRMYAMPFISSKAITVDQIGVYVSTLSTTTARLGIYSDNGNCYPGTLLLDAGTIDVTATGAKKLAINQALEANKLYWLVIVCAATPAIYCIPVASVISILGTSSALGTAQNAGLFVAQTYGVLPGTFPGSPTMITAAPIPAIFVRLSS